MTFKGKCSFGDSNSQRNGKRFEEGLNSMVKLSLYRTF